MPRAKKSDLEVTVNEQPKEETVIETEKAEDVVPTEEPGSEDSGASAVPTEDPPKKKRTTRKKEPSGGDDAVEDPVIPATPAVSEVSVSEETPKKRPPRKVREAPVLTIASGDDIETQEDRDEIIWHEIQNAYRTRKIITGVLGGVERSEGGSVIAIVYYKDLRVVIPMSEMMINLSAENNRGGEMLTRQAKILGNSIGAEIDFVVKGIDSKSRTAVASRKDAMMKKRKLFYFDTDASGQYRVYEGRVVQARVIAVAEKVIRVEMFGVETAILARDLTYDWMGDARDKFHVGDQVLVRIQEVKRDSIEELRVKADVKSVTGDPGRDNLKKCKVQGKYAGKVTDVHKGVVFVRLGIGVNAVAHSCYDSRMPGKKDDVSFAVTRIDEEKNVALGIITRIIKQNF